MGLKNKAKKALNIPVIAKVGDRRIYYTEVFLIKSRVCFAGIAEFKNKDEARKDIRKKILKKHGNIKYKIKKLFLLPAEFEIEEAN